MTLDERVKALMAELSYLYKTTGGVAGFEKKLRLALQEMERDTRHAAAEAINALEGGKLVPHGQTYISQDRAHAAVMNLKVE